MTQREGDTLSEGQAAPFIVNFKMLDASDGKITEAEFKDGCKKGLVQEASAEGSQQPPEKPLLEVRCKLKRARQRPHSNSQSNT